MHNVAIYFMTFLSEHYMMRSPNRDVYRADKRVQCRQLVNCLLTEQNTGNARRQARMMIWMKIRSVLCDVSDT